MAVTATEQMILQMSADMTRLNRNVVAGQRAFDRQLLAMERRAQAADRRLSQTMARAGQNMVSSLRTSLVQIAPTLAAAFSGAQIVAFADAWTQGRNALAGAGVATDDLARRQERLVGIANDSRTGTQETISLYTRLSIATQELGMGTETTLRLTELLNKSFQASGATTAEAASSALQLSQALASGVLQGDELRSLRESAPQLAKAIADSMGVSIGALKQLGAEGKITAQIVAGAILQAGDDIETKFNATATTVGQALTILNNSLGQYVGQADSGVSATGRMAEAIVALAQNLDRIVPIIGVLVSLLGAKMVLALTANSGAMIANGVAAARLTAFQTAMTASMTGTTRATVVATAASRAFGAALAVNPVGAAIIAVAALAAAFGILAARQREADQRVEELRTSLAGAKDALDAYEDAARTAANATGENAAKMRESAEAARIDALYRLENARAIRIQTAALAEQRAREALVADQQANTVGTPYPGLMGGNSVRASQRSIQARREADAAAAAEREASARYDQITKNMETGAYKVTVTPGPVKATKTSGSSGTSPEDLARARELLDLEAKVELLRAQGREADARSVQRQIDYLNLAKRYEEAGFENVEEKARQQVDSILLAEDAARGREFAAERTKAILDAVAEALVKQRENQDRLNDAAAEELQFRAELARLSGDPARIEQAEREVYIAQRVNDLLRDKVGLITEADTAAARNQATGEYAALDGAEREGALREEFRRSFKDGIQAALDGDMAGFFENLADRFTDRMLDNLADNLFDLVSQAAKGFGSAGGGGAGGWMSAIASVFGARATGGPVTAGSPYIVGERRAEVFVPNVNGTVIPSVNAAMGRMDQASAARAQQAVAVRIEVNDDRFDAYVDGRAAPLAVQTTAAGVAYSQDQQRNAGRRRRQSLI